MLTDINRSIIGVIFRRRTVTPRRKPVAVVEVVVTATDQFNTGIMRMIPTLIVPFRMIGTEYFVLLALPVFTSFDMMVLVESNRLNLLRFWLRVEVCVLRFDLLHLLWFRLFRLYPRLSLRVLLDASRSWRSCAGFSRGVLPTLLSLLNLLLLPDLCRHSRRGRLCRFL